MSPLSPLPPLTTIGHSTHTVERFVALCRAAGITAIADVRTSPYSARAPQFNREALERALTAAGVAYVWLGPELGGRPGDPACYDPDGHCRYDIVARQEWFRAGLRRLEQGLARYQVAVMCAEEDPAGCHRRLLVARALFTTTGRDARHVRGDGRVETEAELLAREAGPAADQLALFGAGGVALDPAEAAAPPARPPLGRSAIPIPGRPTWDDAPAPPRRGRGR